jgi:hypothetical protein
MAWNSVLELLRQYIVPGGLGTVVGGLLAHFIESYRGRVKELEYNVAHSPLGTSVEDVIHGSIQVLWQGQTVKNLYNSIITLMNQTSQDYKDLVVAIYSQDATFILSDRVEVSNSTFLPQLRKEFIDRITTTPVGGELSEPQKFFFYHRREYTIPVLNRGESAVFRYLTTVPTNVPPAIFMESLEKGVKAVFRPVEAMALGVPYRFALGWGTLACVVILLILRLYSSGWYTISIAMFCGYMVQPIGAYLHRIGRAVKRIVLH